MPELATTAPPSAKVSKSALLFALTLISATSLFIEKVVMSALLICALTSCLLEAAPIVLMATAPPIEALPKPNEEPHRR
ncbi:MAG: hypothetical protein II335_01615 [Firmicutes bacterium]|nr:hypothetical protein [Bacillota bacterium]